MLIGFPNDLQIIVQKGCLKPDRWNIHPKSLIGVASNLVPLVHADFLRFQGVSLLDLWNSKGSPFWCCLLVVFNVLFERNGFLVLSHRAGADQRSP